MKIQDALPDLFKRTHPMIQAETSTLVAASLLRFHQIDLLPVAKEVEYSRRRQGRPLAVFGYSLLRRLLQKDPKDYYKFLFQPCGSATVRFWSASSEDDISRILAMFRSSHFGFCYVETPDGLSGLVALRDLLALYDEAIIGTGLSAGDVASPVFSMKGDSPLKDVLHEMFRRKVRRVFVSGRKALVSDRRIIQYIFSPERLKEARNAPHKMLDATLGEVGPIEPTEIDSSMSIERVARVIMNETEECMLCPAGAVTPWDLVMKPWMMGRLRIRDSVKDFMQIAE